MDQRGINNPSSSNSNPPSVEELRLWISKATSGSQDHQKRIYDLLASRVYRVIRKIVGVHHADDVMQDFVIHLFEKLNQFRFESSLETWAHRMAVNQSFQYLRKANRIEERSRRVVASRNTLDSSDPNHRFDDAEILQLALEQISGEQRAILHMKEVDGLGYGAIGDILGIPAGTVGSRLNKARNELRAALVRLGWGA